MYSSDPERRQIRLRPGVHRLDESATGYSSASWSPPLLASASPDVAMVRPVAGNRQPPLGEGWGIFNWRNGEFSGPSAILMMLMARAAPHRQRKAGLGGGAVRNRHGRTSAV